MFTVEGFTYKISEEITVIGSGNEMCYSLEASLEKEDEKNIINGLFNILIHQNHFPVIFSFVDYDCSLNICEVFNKMSIKYKLSNFPEVEDLSKLQNQRVIEAEIEKKEELISMLNYTLTYASYGLPVIISTNCILQNTASHLEYLYIHRIINSGEKENSTIIYNENDNHIWGIVTNCKDFKSRDSLKNIMSNSSCK